MIFNLDGGHALIGAVGARDNGYKEEVEDRKVVTALKNKLERLGHKVNIVSCDNEPNKNKQLSKITEKSNSLKSDIFISIHLNSFHSASAHGVEVYYYPGSEKGFNYAKKVCDHVCSLGYYNRGAKAEKFYVLQNTNVPAILVECGFITNKNDMDRFDPDKIADKIIYAITGETVYNKEEPKEIFYRVVAGSYKDKNNALKIEKELKEKGYSAFLVATEV